MRIPETGLVDGETARAINEIEGKSVRCTICGAPMPHDYKQLGYKLNQVSLAKHGLALKDGTN